MPRPLLGGQIKAEIKGFLLRYHLFSTSIGFFQILNSNIFQIHLLRVSTGESVVLFGNQLNSA
jgi:hypothetical protein